MLLADDKVWDQNGFNEIVRKQLGPSVDGDSGLFYAYDGNLKVGILPASIFCSGHTYFVQVHLSLHASSCFGRFFIFFFCMDTFIVISRFCCRLCTNSLG